MSYILGTPPRTPSDAFDALDNVFGSEEFSADDAEEVISEVLDLSASEARSAFNGLLRSQAVEEA